ncbi:MAG: transcription termination factor NusA [Deltaproteobacteria bacterium]|jgi:N utilization substance protein A|nr:transcription termination factor NusA [Deltaproteobacteria bacterium]
MTENLKRIIEQISRDKGLDKQVLIETMSEAISSAAKRKYGLTENFEVSFNDDSGEFEVFRFHDVVEEVDDPNTQISLEEARKLDPASTVGDELGVKLDTRDFGRIAAQSAKQVVIQRMKDAERRIIYDEYKDRVGKIALGQILRVEKGNNIIVGLGRPEALLPTSEQIIRETYYHRGERLKALVIDVRLDSRGPQIILSRTHPDFLAALFEAEVPEIFEGIVKIVGVAREAGSRSKIAVSTTDPEIDPVGACVGLRGSRVQGVVQELKGEKVDIIPYSNDIAHYVASALAPASVLRVVVDEDARSLEVVVPDDQLSLAIGRKGQNVRLASRLVGWRIDVKNETKYQRSLKDGYQSLLRLPGIGESTADLLYEAGYGSARDILEVTPEQLAVVEGLQGDKASQVWDAAKLYVENLDREDAEEAEREAMAKDFFGGAKGGRPRGPEAFRQGPSRALREDEEELEYDSAGPPPASPRAPDGELADGEAEGVQAGGPPEGYPPDAGSGEAGTDGGDGAQDSGGGFGAQDSGGGFGAQDSGGGFGAQDSGGGFGAQDSGDGDGAQDSGDGDGAQDSGDAPEAEPEPGPEDDPGDGPGSEPDGDGADGPGPAQDGPGGTR